MSFMPSCYNRQRPPRSCEEGSLGCSEPTLGYSERTPNSHGTSAFDQWYADACHGADLSYSDRTPRGYDDGALRLRESGQSYGLGRSTGDVSGLSRGGVSAGPCRRPSAASAYSVSSRTSLGSASSCRTSSSAATTIAGGGRGRCPYQLGFEARHVGRQVASTKRVLSFRYGFADGAALRAGHAGPECRGEEHEIVVLWSVTGGKRQISMDGREIQYAAGKRAMNAARRADVLEAAWRMNDHVYELRCHAYPQKRDPQWRQYALTIDGRSFFELPHVVDLGGPGPGVPFRAGPPSVCAASVRTGRSAASSVVSSGMSSVPAAPPPPAKGAIQARIEEQRRLLKARKKVAAATAEEAEDLMSFRSLRSSLASDFTSVTGSTRRESETLMSFSSANFAGMGLEATRRGGQDRREGGPADEDDPDDSFSVHVPQPQELDTAREGTASAPHAPEARRTTPSPQGEPGRCPLPPSRDQALDTLYEHGAVERRPTDSMPVHHPGQQLTRQWHHNESAPSPKQRQNVQAPAPSASYSQIRDEPRRSALESHENTRPLENEPEKHQLPHQTLPHAALQAPWSVVTEKRPIEMAQGQHPSLQEHPSTDQYQIPDKQGQDQRSQPSQYTSENMLVQRPPQRFQETGLVLQRPPTYEDIMGSFAAARPDASSASQRRHGGDDRAAVAAAGGMTGAAATGAQDLVPRWDEGHGHRRDEGENNMTGSATTMASRRHAKSSVDAAGVNRWGYF